MKRQNINGGGGIWTKTVLIAGYFNIIIFSFQKIDSG